MNLYTSLAESLYQWYQKNKRDLPWRRDKNPYNIWISEVMLQQTTTQAVIPYFERFINKFPTVFSLAAAKESEVLEHWSGLGYYTRAKNIHRAAKEISKNGFPQTYQQLILLPGFGPYTSRAVSSIAFAQKVGVVDGNVIRVLSRLFNLKIACWKSEGKKKFQHLSDQIASCKDPSVINQALMDLGATVCTTHSPLCGICPLTKKCKGKENYQQLPLKKPKIKNKILFWQPEVCVTRNIIAITTKHNLPVLKDNFLFDGNCVILEEKPQNFDFKHNITNHEIYVKCKIKRNVSIKNKQNTNWVKLSEVSKHSPSSLIKKVIKVYEQQIN